MLKKGLWTGEAVLEPVNKDGFDVEARSENQVFQVINRLTLFRNMHFHIPYRIIHAHLLQYLPQGIIEFYHGMREVHGEDHLGTLFTYPETFR
jgi:hypothetical protein